MFADSGYRGVSKRAQIKEQEHLPEWHVAMMPSKRKALDRGTALGAIREQLEKLQKLNSAGVVQTLLNLFLEQFSQFS